MKYNQLYGEFRKKFFENILYVADGHIDPDEAGEDIDVEDLFDQVDQLEKDSPINILRGKELRAIYIEEGKVVGAMYVEELRDEFSFDIIVHEEYQGQGIGSKLLDLALEEYNMQKDGNDDMTIRLDVVNPLMKKALEKRGFDIKEDMKDRWIMGEIDVEDGEDEAEDDVKDTEMGSDKTEADPPKTDLKESKIF